MRQAVSLSLIGLALALFLGGQVFYVFIFLPKHHDGVGEPLGQGVLDWDGWWAFTKSTPGLVIRGCALLALLGGALIGLRRPREGSGS